MATEQQPVFSLTVTSVGAVVVRDGQLLVGRHTYGPSRGKYMLPGGVVEPGELPDIALVREVREETGVEARPLGVIGALTSIYQGQTHTFLLWLMEPISGDGAADGVELDECSFIALDELVERNDVTDLVKYIAARVCTGSFSIQQHADDFTAEITGVTWKLFL